MTLRDRSNNSSPFEYVRIHSHVTAKMTDNHIAFQKALLLIDEANRRDPNIATSAGKEWPKELLYSERMTNMLERFVPDADQAVQLAVRAQHIERWKTPRDSYPAGRIGYLTWRKDLYKIQADTAVELLREAGCDDATMARVSNMIAKRNLKGSIDTQMLEDVAALVFLEWYLLDFVNSHPNYSEEKLGDIITKTWNKMSSHGQEFVLAGRIALPQELEPLFMETINGVRVKRD